MNLRSEPHHPHRYLGAALLALVALVGCDLSSDGDDRSLRRELERQAAARPAKATVTLGAIHHFTGPDTSPPLRANVGADASVEIRQAFLVVSAIELHACVPGVDEYESRGAPLLNWLWDGLVPPARAHVANSTNRLGTPYVENLLGDADRARIIGKISPPLAAYCRVAAVVAPADGDVRNSTPLSTEAIVGSSLLVRGRWRPSKGAPWEEFEVKTDAARAFEFEAIDPRSGKPPLVLATRGDEKMVLVDKRLGPETFALDPTSERAGRDILERLGTSMRVYEF